MTDSVDPVVEIDDPKLIIYTNSSIRCPYCVRAKEALTMGSYAFDERDIADPAVKAELMQKRPTARTVPQIFLIDDTYIGGCDDLMVLMEHKTLDLLIDVVS